MTVAGQRRETVAKPHCADGAFTGSGAVDASGYRTLHQPFFRFAFASKNALIAAFGSPVP